MRSLILFIAMIILSSGLLGLTLDDIVRLSAANIGDDVIIEIIKTSDIQFKIGTEEIISLKKQGVSNQVIMAIVERGSSQQKRSAASPTANKRERSSFDHFFLSPYYSHQYGWPEPNYRNPREILESGLYYRSPNFYPHSRRVRVYGWGYPYLRQRQSCSSPFSLIIPREDTEDSGQSHNIFEEHPVPDSDEHDSPGLLKEEALSSPHSKTQTSTVKPDIDLGEWYQALESLFPILEMHIRKSAKSTKEASLYLIQIQDYVNKMRQYKEIAYNSREKIRRQNDDFPKWFSEKLQKTSYMAEKNTLYALHNLVSKGKVNLGVEDEVMDLIIYTMDWERDIQQGVLRTLLLKNILLRMELIHNKFTDMFHQIEAMQQKHK